MTLEILRIHLPFPFNVSQLYSHLLKTDSGYYLVDTGHSSSRSKLLAELEKHGCTADNLRLILLTHGDFDHVGNAVYLQQVWGVNIFMHALDAGMLERGEAFHKRVEVTTLSKPLLKRMVLTKKTDHGRADIFIEDGTSLAEHGLD